MSALDEALPERRGGLVIFNDQRCRSIAELRALILKARAIAIRNDAHERAAEALRRRLLREIEEERAAQSAAGDDHSDRSGDRLRRPRSRYRDYTAISPIPRHQVSATSWHPARKKGDGHAFSRHDVRQPYDGRRSDSHDDGMHANH